LQNDRTSIEPLSSQGQTAPRIQLASRWGGCLAAPNGGRSCFLADLGVVGEPDFHGFGGEALLLGEGVQRRGEAFLSTAMAPAACA